MSTTISPLAGKSAPMSLLADVPNLLAAYDELRPDPKVPAQRVAFGTSGHRGFSFERSFKGLRGRGETWRGAVRGSNRFPAMCVIEQTVKEILHNLEPSEPAGVQRLHRGNARWLKAARFWRREVCARHGLPMHHAQAHHIKER